MRYGDHWPAPQTGGGPAITPPPPRSAGRVDRYVGKWARLWLASHPACQSHPECQGGTPRNTPQAAPRATQTARWPQ